MRKYAFAAIAENFRLSKSFEKNELISEHWNVFNSNFDEIITDERIWDRMLRNALTLGLNDNLLDVSNKFSKSDHGLWTRLRSGNYEDLIFDIPYEDKDTINFHKKIFMATIKFTGLKFALQNTLSNVGSPVVVKFKTDGSFGVSEIRCNLHDVWDIQHCWQF